MGTCLSLTEKDITAFLEYYRANFPQSAILPKMHLLEDHVVPWIKRWGLGAGLMGEQGAESIHAHLNKLEATYSSIPNRVDRLRYIFNTYTLETTPELSSLRPAAKKRKLKKNQD